MQSQKLLSVTDLCAYKFCPRSLYIKLVLGLREPPKPVMVLGSVRHKVFEDANRIEESLVLQTDSGMAESDFHLLFSNAYRAILAKSVATYSSQLAGMGVDVQKVQEEMQSSVHEQAIERADEILRFSKKSNLFGRELWNNLTPKIISELKVASEKLKLKGIIDRIEVYGDEYVPVEIKTGRVPYSGVWPDHQLQLSAYKMLINEALGRKVKEGLVRYTKENTVRQIVFNPFMEFEVNSAINDVFSLVEEKKIPQICRKPYCTVCSYEDNFAKYLIRPSY